MPCLPPPWSLLSSRLPGLWATSCTDFSRPALASNRRAMTESSKPLPSELPEPVVPISWLLGTWVGVGLGTFPTIEDFRFGQEVTFTNDGRPFLIYTSKSWILDEEGNRLRPAATESGFWRPQPDNQLEVLLVHSTGHLETYLGTNEVTSIADATITGARCELKTDVVVRSNNAKEYDGGVRLYGLIEGDLGWAYDMAVVGEPLTNHLSARLAKVD